MVRQKPAKLPFPSSNLGATYGAWIVRIADRTASTASAISSSQSI